RLDFAARRGVREYAPAELRTIEPAAFVEDRAAEPTDERGEAGRAGLDDLARNRVSVDDRRAVRGEEPRHGRLAARDPAREPDAQHRGSAQSREREVAIDDAGAPEEGDPRRARQVGTERYRHAASKPAGRNHGESDDCA